MKIISRIVVRNRDDHNYSLCDYQLWSSDIIKKCLFKPIIKNFIRFGKFPLTKHSYNYRDDFYENGLSVYYAGQVGNQIYPIVPTHTNSLLTYTSISYRWPACLVSGEQCGIGSDGEPVIKDARIIKPIKIHQLRRAY